MNVTPFGTWYPDNTRSFSVIRAFPITVGIILIIQIQIIYCPFKGEIYFFKLLYEPHTLFD